MQTQRRPAPAKPKMSYTDIDSVLADWDRIAAHSRSMRCLHDEIYEEFDAQIAASRKDYDIVAARFLLDALQDASVISAPPILEPSVPLLSLPTTRPGVADSAVTGAVPKVTADASDANPVSLTSTTLKAFPSLASVPIQRPALAPAPAQGNASPDGKKIGRFDQTSAKFVRPPSATATRKTAHEKLVHDDATSGTRNFVADINSTRRAQLVEMIRQEQAKRKGRPRRQGQETEIENGVFYVVDAKGNLVGSFRNAPPRKLSRIADPGVREKDPVVESSAPRPAAGLGSPELFSAEALTKTKTQADLETDKILERVQSYQKQSFNLLNVVVPSQGVTIRMDGKTKRGPALDRTGQGARMK